MTTMKSEESKALLADTQCHTAENNATDDLYDTADPEKRAAVEAIEAASLPSNGAGLRISTDTEYLRPLQQKLSKLLEIISTEGRSRIGKNQKRTRRHIEYIKAYVENLPNLLKDGSAYVDYDYLNDLEASIDELIAAEKALRSENGRANGFVIEPLDNGDVLIRFRGDWGDGGWYSSGAQIVSRACFNALANADPERKRIVNPRVDLWLMSVRHTKRFRVQTTIDIDSYEGKTGLQDGHWQHDGLFESLEASLRNGCYTEISEAPKAQPVESKREQWADEITGSEEKAAPLGFPTRYRVQCEIEVEIDSDDDLENALKYGNWEPNNVIASISDALQEGKYVKVEMF